MNQVRQAIPNKPLKAIVITHFHEGKTCFWVKTKAFRNLLVRRIPCFHLSKQVWGSVTPGSNRARVII